MEKLLLLPSKEKKIQRTVEELDKLNVSFKAEEEKYKKRKNELQNIIKDYTDKNNIEEFGYNTSNGFKKVKPIIIRKITWDIPALRKKIKNKLILSDIIDKTYTINNYPDLVDYLMECGVEPKEFKKYINVDQKVNNKKVDELNALGELSYDDLAGCYELQASLSYVKISDLEASDAEGGGQ